MAVFSAEDPAGRFTDLLIQTAENTIPKICFYKKNIYKNFPNFHGLMIIARKQLKKKKKKEKRSESFFKPNVNQC